MHDKLDSIAVSRRCCGPALVGQYHSLCAKAAFANIDLFKRAHCAVGHLALSACSGGGWSSCVTQVRGPNLHSACCDCGQQ
jgi:hypothetical protein